ncbi:MAG: hypothetical protein QME74_04225, partial [Candidatus Edwardsbacteria bacterium]|nr:hypothetical protein [Candidatus Edwardsbacteria bacterium]
MRIHAIFRNLDIRIASLLLATMLWFHAVTEEEYRVTVRCPVAVINIPSGWTLLNRPAFANCTITASGKGIIALKLFPPKITVDAANRQIKRMSV